MSGLPCDSFCIHPGLYACLPAQCFHESLIPFELSNAIVTFHQPAHSAELYQPFLGRAPHSGSKIDWVLGHCHKDKGGQTQHLRFAFKMWYHNHPFWLLKQMLMKFSGIYLHNPMSSWTGFMDTSSRMMQWNINDVLLSSFISTAKQLKLKWHSEDRPDWCVANPVSNNLPHSPALLFSKHDWSTGQMFNQSAAWGSRSCN